MRADMNYRALGRRVLDRRRALRLCQEVLSQRAGVSRNYISQIERGKAENVSLNILYRLSHALDMSPFELMRQDDFVRKEAKMIQKNVLKMPELWTLVANLVFSNVLYFSTKYMSPGLAMDVKFFVDSVQPLIVFVVGLLGAARIAAMVVYAVKDPEYRARFVEKFAK